MFYPVLQSNKVSEYGASKYAGLMRQSVRVDGQSVWVGSSKSVGLMYQGAWVLCVK